jgi:phage regulator Rha-like protein
MNLITTKTMKMTSLEIAELVNSRHDKVKQSIERLVERGVIVQPPLGDEQSNDAMGRPRTTQVCIFAGTQGKRDSIVVVAQLSPEFTARLVDRWQELEQALITRPQPAVQIPATPASQARNIIEEGMAVAALFGVPVHIAQAESVKLARINTGFDFSGYLLVAPAQDNIREDEVMLEPTELGRRLNVSKAKINPLLAELGLQTKVGSDWVPTEKGLSMCFKHQWVVGTKSGYNLKWNVAAVSKLIQEKD